MSKSKSAIRDEAPTARVRSPAVEPPLPDIQAPVLRATSDSQTQGEPRRVTAVLNKAREEGLLKAKNSRITGRVSADLIHQAKARTGIGSDTDLIEFALASLALEDSFVEAFRSREGTVSRDLDLEF